MNLPMTLKTPKWVLALSISMALGVGWLVGWWQFADRSVSRSGLVDPKMNPQEAQLLQRSDEIDYLIEVSRAWLDYSASTARDLRASAWAQFRPELQKQLQSEYEEAHAKIERHQVEQRLQVQRVEQIGEHVYLLRGNLLLHETRPGTARRRLALTVHQRWEFEVVERDLRHPRGLRVKDWRVEHNPPVLPSLGLRISAGHSLQIQVPCEVTQVDLHRLRSMPTQIRNQNGAGVLTLLPIEEVREAAQIQISCNSLRVNFPIYPGVAESGLRNPIDRYWVIPSSWVKLQQSAVQKVKKSAEEKMGFVIDEAPGK
ncbi:MAG TPA: hypothetical protein PLZ57_07825 [Pseudobdellovibrionaceae bacterium]|nr:hypothetical protein [Pseudobdellovibrionaceae bacterium]